jgi:glycyl-tRNA synthetase beta chain
VTASKIETRNSKLENRHPAVETRNSKGETGSSVVVEEPSSIAGAVVIEEQLTIDNRQSAIPQEEQSPITHHQSPMTLPLLLEVGCEEIPARFLRDAEKSLGERVQAMLGQARLLPPIDDVREMEAVRDLSRFDRELPLQTFSTPRRLVVYVPALLAQQPDKVEEILGPPVKVAIDLEGKYTRAAESFAQKNSALLKELTHTTTPKGEYLSLKKTTRGLPAIQILPEVLPIAILGLTFPKSMYWTEKSAPRFVRPIRWIVALLGEGKNAVTVDFKILGVKTGNFSFGHRAKSAMPIAVSSFKDYTNKLCQNLVEIDYNLRRDRIIVEARALMGVAVGKIIQDDWLTDWIANSTEWPRPMLGSFDERFLHLPREILITVMRDHQRYFAVEDGQGNLRPHFVAVLNMESDEKGLIRQGHQRVLTARFRDAEFFWNADQKLPLHDRVPLLDKVTYQAKLGSYGDKIRRMKSIAESTCVLLEANGVMTPSQTLEVLRAVELCKSDLTTQMVQEFTELQGVVGGLYAKAQGEPEEIAVAIYDHYLPLGAEGASPRTLGGALVSLADKVDSVVGGFVAGLEPTGSRDPFALRRAGNGLIKVLVEFNIPIFLTNLAMEALGAYELDWHGALDPIASFLEDRLKFYLETIGGCRHDTVRAVLAVGRGIPVEALKRARAVEKVRDTDDYTALAAAAKRTRNILRKSANPDEYQSGSIDVTLLQEEAEVELYNAYGSTFQQVMDGGILAGDYETILTLTARLRRPIDKFFDKVLVMHSDVSIRKNRLLLLRLLEKYVFSRVVDLSEIEGNVDAPTSAR